MLSHERKFIFLIAESLVIGRVDLEIRNIYVNLQRLKLFIY
jgi:hypothetical protein